MKKLTNLIFAAILMLMAAGLQAQVTEVCAGDGTDSVTLSLTNYQYGNIQWQYSEDTLTWTDIRGARDTVCRFLPEQECYVRARIEYPNCPVDTTQVTHILFTPTADAGPDRILNEGYVTTLFGSRAENARCMWQVIEGDSADLEDPTFRNSHFSGPDTLYRLTWTVANACGVSVDTVEIRYVHTVMYDAIAIVDTTDIILSDSAEMASGIYRIIFSEPKPNISDSTILVGIPNGGFLRKVVYFENRGDTCMILTSQATLDDILEEGVIHFDADMAAQATEVRGDGDYIRLDHLPTRAEILSDQMYQSGKTCFYDFPTELDGLSEMQTRSREVGWDFSIPLGTIPSIDALSGAISFSDLSFGFSSDPFFAFHKDSWSDGLTFELRDASITANFKVNINHSVGLGLSGGGLTFNVPLPEVAKLVKRFFLVVYGVPVEVKAEVGIKVQGKVGVSVTSATTLDVSIGTGLFTAGVNFDGAMPVPIPPTMHPVFDISNKSELLKVEGELSLEFGPELDVKLYEVLGPYADFMGRVEFNVCRSALSDFTQRYISYGPRIVFDLGVDVEIPIIKKSLLDIHFRWAPDCLSLIKKNPKKLSRLSDMSAHFSPGSWLTEPFRVKVLGDEENLFGLSPMKVKFKTSNGVISTQPSGTGVSETYVTTDAQGIAQIYWKPGNNQVNLLTATLDDCDGNPLMGSPVNFYAYNGPDCSESTLGLDVVKGKLSPSGGETPYWYSPGVWAGLPTSFEFSMPQTLELGKTYYVRDANNCIASATYQVTEESPTTCGVALQYQINGSSLTATVQNGTAPYHYFVDYADNPSALPPVDITPLGTNETSCTWNNGVPGTAYKMWVTDSQGCTDTISFSIADPVTLPFVFTNEAYNTQKNVYDTVNGIVVDDGNSPILSRGVEWSLSPDMTNASNVWSPFSGSGLGSYTCAIPSAVATPGTTYYARAYATNSKGTAYGDTISITVPGSAPSGSTNSCAVSSIRSNETGSDGTITAVRDHENNSYAVVQIGSQCWLKHLAKYGCQYGREPDSDSL